MDFVDLFPFAPEVGYLSLTLVNFFGSLIPFVPLPGFLLAATMAVGDQFNLHVLAIISALTATAAKQIIFYVSYGGRKIINEKTCRRPQVRLMVPKRRMPACRDSLLEYDSRGCGMSPRSLNRQLLSPPVFFKHQGRRC